MYDFLQKCWLVEKGKEGGKRKKEKNILFQIETGKITVA